MTRSLNDQDWEKLSAYMDGRMSSSEKSLIDQRIRSEAEWAAAYQSLVRTRTFLREIPKAKRRRNFFLTSEMVRKSSWLRIIPTLNFSSVAAAVLAVFLFILDIFPLAPAMNRAVAPQASAPLVQDLAARPAAEANLPGKSELDLTQPAAGINELTQVGEIPQNRVSPQATSSPGEIILSTMPPAAAVAAPPAPAPEEPQILAESSQPDQGPVGLPAPSMKEAPSESLAIPSPAEESQATLGESIPAPGQTVDSTNQPETQQMEKALMPASGPEVETLIEPTELAGQKSGVPTQINPGSVKTQILPAPEEQTVTEVQHIEMATATVVPASGGGSINNSPTATVIPPEEGKRQLPISEAETFIKIGWMTLLFISGTLALLSAILRKKSLS